MSFALRSLLLPRRERDERIAVRDRRTGRLMFTTWTFWIGALWGAGVMAVGLWYWLIHPMGQMLGFEDES